VVRTPLLGSDNDAFAVCELYAAGALKTTAVAAAMKPPTTASVEDTATAAAVVTADLASAAVSETAASSTSGSSAGDAGDSTDGDNGDSDGGIGSNKVDGDGGGDDATSLSAVTVRITEQCRVIGVLYTLQLKVRAENAPLAQTSDTVAAYLVQTCSIPSFRYLLPVVLACDIFDSVFAWADAVSSAEHRAAIAGKGDVSVCSMLFLY
jgi:hypothetical protein